MCTHQLFRKVSKITSKYTPLHMYSNSYFYFNFFNNSYFKKNQLWFPFTNMARFHDIPGASRVVLVVKNCLSMQETQVWSLGREDPLEQEIATDSSILAWKTLWREEPGRLKSMGSQSQTRLSDWATKGVIVILNFFLCIFSYLLGILAYVTFIYVIRKKKLYPLWEK